MMIADSDLLIDFLRGKQPGTQRIKIELATERLGTTAINAFELLSGAHSKKERDKVVTLLAALTVLPVDEQAALLAAEARSNLEASGLGIGMADYLIAGVCLSNGATLLTRNLDHFSRVRGLNVGALHA